jgi:hypothetical protein
MSFYGIPGSVMVGRTPYGGPLQPLRPGGYPVVGPDPTLFPPARSVVRAAYGATAIDYETVERIAAAYDAASEGDPVAETLTATTVASGEPVAATTTATTAVTDAMAAPLPHWSDHPLELSLSRRQAARKRRQAQGLTRQPSQAPAPWGSYAIALIAALALGIGVAQAVGIPLKKKKKKKKSKPLPPPVRSRPPSF